jgi:hypothetical protein
LVCLRRSRRGKPTLSTGYSLYKLGMSLLMLRLLVLPVVMSSGEITRLRYKYDETLLQLPADAPEMLNGHGLAKDVDGNVYFTYELASDAAKGAAQCLVRFSPSDGYAIGVMEGDGALSEGTPHGLRIDYGGGVSAAQLYHANNNQAIRKTDLNGSVLWTGGLTPPNNASEYWPYMPTDAVVAPPGGEKLFVADGYGSSYVHVMDAATGEWLDPDASFGGGGGAAHGELHTPHGINWDGRAGRERLVISDRSNGRIEYYNLDGTYNATAADNSTIVDLSQPCNVDLDLERGLALVPDVSWPGGTSEGSCLLAYSLTHVISYFRSN